VTSPNLHDCAAMYRALNEHRPGWTWHPTNESLPNGRYWVCAKQNGMWLAGHLTGDDGMRAFLDAGQELLGGACHRSDPDVVPMSYVSRRLERPTGRRRSYGKLG